MNKQGLVSVLIGISVTALAVLLVGLFAVGGSIAAPSLPQVEFLGEGAGEYTTTLDDFIVKKSRAVYEFEPGPTYTAVSGEKVWSITGTKDDPQLVMDNSIYPLGPATEGCTVEYVGIDDDENGVRNAFFVGSTMVDLIVEGMTFQGNFPIPYDSTQFRFVAEEDLALWYSPCEEPEPTPEPTSIPEPVIQFLPLVVGGSEDTAKSYTLECDQDPDPRIIGDEVEYNFSATALVNGDPLADVVLRAEVDPGQGTPPSDTEETNNNGVADFRLETLISDVIQAPLATVTFEDQATYGNVSCTIRFDEEPPPPTPTPVPATYSVVCDPDYTIRLPGEEVKFEFSATAYYNEYTFADVDLKAVLDTGDVAPFNVEKTNFNGVADFRFTVVITSISQTPVATVTFNDQATYGDASCTINFSESDALMSLVAD